MTTKLRNEEKYLLRQFEDNEWMTRAQIDPMRIYGRELRRLQQSKMIVSRKVHDFDKEYALSDRGWLAVYWSLNK